MAGIGEEVKRVLDQHNVEWVDSGPNVRRGNIGVACPFCGDDPSHHMGINMESGVWGCWRDKKHSGRRAAYLVARLIGTSVSMAEELLGIGGMNEDEFSSLVRGEYFRENDNEEAEAAMMRSCVEEEFVREYKLKKVRLSSPTSRYFLYLAKVRGFGKHTKQLVRQYELYCAYVGYFRDRIVFPVRSAGAVVAAVGRTIHKGDDLRYKALPEGALTSIKDVLYNGERAAEGGKVLVVMEGPLDALKVDFFGKVQGVRAVGVSSASISESQAAQLYDLAKGFELIVFGLDPGFEGQAYAMRDSAPLRDVKSVVVCRYPDEAEDAGAMTPEQSRKFAAQLVSMV